MTLWQCNNEPFVRPLGRCFTDLFCEDQTVDLHIASEIDPVPLGRHRLPNGQIMEYWLLVQEDCPIFIAYWCGMPDRLRQGESYDCDCLAMKLCIERR